MRRWQYPSHVKVISTDSERITPDKWYAPPQPVPRAHQVVTAVIASSLFFVEVPVPKVTSYQREISTPVRLAPQPRHPTIVYTEPAGVVPRTDYMQPAQVPRLPRVQVFQPSLFFVEVVAAAPVVPSVDSYQRELSVPVLPLPSAIQPTIFIAGLEDVPVPRPDYLQPPQIPVRRPQAPLQPTIFVAGLEDVPVPRADYMQPPQLPVPARASAPPVSLFFVEVVAAAAPEVELDKWEPRGYQPRFDRPRTQYLYPVRESVPLLEVVPPVTPSVTLDDPSLFRVFHFGRIGGVLFGKYWPIRNHLQIIRPPTSIPDLDGNVQQYIVVYKEVLKE